MTNLTKALLIATAAHDGQEDKAGQPYILHPIRVMLDGIGDTEEERVVALLHDTVEDTKLTLEDIRIAFGDIVTNAVEALTRRGDEETYFEYITRVVAGGVTSIIVKWADIQDHLRVETIQYLSASHAERYLKARAILEHALADLAMENFDKRAAEKRLQ